MSRHLGNKISKLYLAKSNRPDTAKFRTNDQ